MKVAFPELRPTIHRNKVSWHGALTPSPLSDAYETRIDYRFGTARPKVWVLSPKLRKREDALKIPHTFGDGSVCLHLPGGWRPNLPIADTIVPWLALWLYHYESWLATGVWLGGGHEVKDE
jgi:hypothetical protein